MSIVSPQSRALSTPRIPRETGFGDFCFGRILKSDRMKSEDWSWSNKMNLIPGTKLAESANFKPYKYQKVVTSEWTEEDFTANSHNTRFVELDGFERKGTFHFEKLPAEIRHRIIRYLLEPVYHYDNLSQQSLVEFSIMDVDSGRWGRSFFEKGIIDFLKEGDRLYGTRSTVTPSVGDENDESDVDRPRSPPLRRAFALVALFWQWLRGALPRAAVSDDIEDEEHPASDIPTEYNESLNERAHVLEGEVFQYPHYFNGLSATDESLIRERYERLKKSHQWEHKIHPERSSQYTLAIKLSKPATNVPVVEKSNEDDDEEDREENDEAAEEEEEGSEDFQRFIDGSVLTAKEQRLDFHMLKLIRQLSNLSAAFRLDLGTVLWASTKLHISGYAALTSGPSIFLMDRPEIFRGIRYLSLDAQYDFGSLKSDDGEGECFGTFCRYLARYVNVAHLQINIILSLGLEQERLEALCSGTSKFAGLRLLRSMIVTESFEVRFQVQRAYEYHRTLLREIEEGLKLKDYLRRAHDLFLPETLRGAVRYKGVEGGMVEVGGDGDTREELLTCGSLLTRR